MDVTQMYISEFVGTAVLIAFGNSTNASILLKKTIVSIFGTNWLHIIFGWAFAVSFGVYVGITLGGPGHLNPAVSANCRWFYRCCHCCTVLLSTF